MSGDELSPLFTRAAFSYEKPLSPLNKQTHSDMMDIDPEEQGILFSRLHSVFCYPYPTLPSLEEFQRSPDSFDLSYQQYKAVVNEYRQSHGLKEIGVTKK